MKRNPTSPYARYNKRPHKYSEFYGRWKSAATEGRGDLAEARREHDEHIARVWGQMPERRKS